MTEADEVAATIELPLQKETYTLDEVRAIVRRQMPGESEQVIDNVAEALRRRYTAGLDTVRKPP